MKERERERRMNRNLDSYLTPYTNIIAEMGHRLCKGKTIKLGEKKLRRKSLQHCGRQKLLKKDRESMNHER